MNIDLELPDYPCRIVLELTPLCNLACAMCPRHYVEKAHGFMPKELWIKLIDEIAGTAQDTVILPFWRGESLLHPDFIDLMELALKKSLRIHISTNGHLVTGKYADVLAKCEFVTFSIHTVFGLTRAREFLSLKINGKPTVQISFVKGEKSTEDLLHTLINHPDLDGFDSIRLYEEHTKDGIFGKSACQSDSQRIFCQKLLDTLVISFDGSISRCNHIWETEKGMNVNSVTIKDAWSSSQLSTIRRAYPDQLCTPCDQWIGHTSGESWRMVDGKVKHIRYRPEDTHHE
ncbi:MAG: radical SAM protein [Nitrospirae bacterium]|nr:radical SAM protein [Nitrospirota bacterium]